VGAWPTCWPAPRAPRRAAPAGRRLRVEQLGSARHDPLAHELRRLAVQDRGRDLTDRLTPAFAAPDVRVQPRVGDGRAGDGSQADQQLLVLVAEGRRRPCFSVR
jgi:hypothetical protein